MSSQEKEMFAMVKRIAWTFAKRLPSHILLDDLIGSGSLGLAEAYQRRGEMDDERFAVFAAMRIRGAILDELRRLDPLTRDARRVAKELDVAVGHGGSESETEVASRLGVSAQLLTRIQASRAANAATTLSLVPAAPDSSPEDLVSEKQTVERVKKATRTLTPRMRQVMESKYDEDCSQSEIARTLGITEARVCQLHADAVRRVAAVMLEQDVA